VYDRSEDAEYVTKLRADAQIHPSKNHTTRLSSRQSVRSGHVIRAADATALLSSFSVKDVTELQS
jgi:hypothetical protein